MSGERSRLPVCLPYAALGSPLGSTTRRGRYLSCRLSSMRKTHRDASYLPSCPSIRPISLFVHVLVSRVLPCGMILSPISRRSTCFSFQEPPSGSGAALSPLSAGRRHASTPMQLHPERWIGVLRGPLPHDYESDDHSRGAAKMREFPCGRLPAGSSLPSPFTTTLDHAVQQHVSPVIAFCDARAARLQ